MIERWLDLGPNLNPILERGLAVMAVGCAIGAVKGFWEGLFPPRDHIDPTDGSRWYEVRRHTLKERIAAKLTGKRVPPDVLERREP